MSEISQTSLSLSTDKQHVCKTRPRLMQNCSDYNVGLEKIVNILSTISISYYAQKQCC